MNHDLFISHASEDKADFVAELASRLIDEGLKVWYDEFSLNPGDSVRRSIEKGIRESRAGLVVFSRAFFNKEWPQRELDSLFSRETSGKTKIYPIWHGVTFSEIEEFSPLLADKVAIQTSNGIDDVVKKVVAIFDGKPLLPDDELEHIVNQFFSGKEYDLSFLTSRCRTEVRRLAAYSGAYSDVIDTIANAYTQDEVEEQSENIGLKVDVAMKKSKALLSIQPGTWLYADELHNDNLEYLEDQLELWCDGTLGQEGSAKLYWDFDEILDTDFLLIFFGIPFERVTGQQRNRLMNEIVRIGSRNTDDKLLSFDQLILHTIGNKYG